MKLAVASGTGMKEEILHIEKLMRRPTLHEKIKW